MRHHPQIPLQQVRLRRLFRRPQGACRAWSAGPSGVPPQGARSSRRTSAFFGGATAPPIPSPTTPSSRRTLSTSLPRWFRAASSVSWSMRMTRWSRARYWRRSSRFITETRWSKPEANSTSTKRKAQEVTRAHDAAKAELRLADARLAKADAARTKIEVAKRDLEVAQTLVAKASKALDLAETGYDQIREVELMVGVKKEMVKDAQIALTSARHQFQFTQIRAPFSGVVIKRYRNLGDFASPGVAMLSMCNADLLYVTANLEETRLPGVAPGNPVELDLDAFDRPFRGRVVWINKSTGAQFALMPRNVVSGEFTKVVQRVPVRIALEKDERWPLLRAGLSVQAIIAHGPGDPQWAEEATREMRDLESRYNQPRK